MGDTLDWPAGLSAQIGAAIRDARVELGISAVKLATRTGELGYPIHRVAISKIESGEREITVAELLVLAAALDVPPINLVIPPDAGEVVVLPGVHLPPEKALEKFTATEDIGQRIRKRADTVIRQAFDDAESQIAALKIEALKAAIEREYRRARESGEAMPDADELSGIAKMFYDDEQARAETLQRLRELAPELAAKHEQVVQPDGG